MEPERWKEIQRLYHLAREREPREREAFLKEACTGDDPLRQEVESLIACRPQVGQFIESPAAAGLPRVHSRNPLGPVDAALGLEQFGSSETGDTGIVPTHIG